MRVETHRRRTHPVLRIKEGTSVLTVQTRAYAQNSNQNYIQIMTVPPTLEWLHISEYGVDASGI